MIISSPVFALNAINSSKERWFISDLKAHITFHLVNELPSSTHRAGGYLNNVIKRISGYTSVEYQAANSTLPLSRWIELEMVLCFFNILGMNSENNTWLPSWSEERICGRKENFTKTTILKLTEYFKKVESKWIGQKEDTEEIQDGRVAWNTDG
jgi:hypothetical protein